MKQEEVNSSQSGLSLSQQSLKANPTTQQTQAHSQAQKEAAVQIIRSQIDDLFDAKDAKEDSVQPQSQQSMQIDDVNPYIRNHTEYPTLQTNDWRHYHTAWQDYYQKYYEGFYKHSQKSVKDKAEPEKLLSAEEAVFDIRQELISKVHKSAKKVKKSRHFLPILSGIIVILIFLFLQYNRLLISNVMTYVSPGNIDSQNIVIDPGSNTIVAPEPRLIIPKINVNVPVFYDIGSDYKTQMAAMNNGLAHFAIPGASSHPGQIGNTVLAGHSSNDLLDSGDYKFIFVQLEKLEVGDVIYANYQSKRYTYAVTKKEVVSPNNINKLVYPTTTPILTLVTCVPIGTSVSRLLVTAEQINPDPSKSTTAPPSSEKTTKAPIPGNSPTLLERLFGAN
jgi:sortase A